MPATDVTKIDAVLVAAGPLPVRAATRLRVQIAAAPESLLVGVDGGAAALTALGVLPHVVTGDGDSLSHAARHELAERGARIVPTPDQNFTDLDKALAYVLEMGGRVVRVFGATGGRLDHTYSALSAVLKHARARPDADIRLVDEWGETFALNTFVTLSGLDLPGRVLSLLALGPVSDVWTTGVRWPLPGDALAPGVRDGTLNEVTETVVTIQTGAGDLLVLLGHAQRSSRP